MASICSFGIAFVLGLILGCSRAEDKLFNVQSYGAKADANTDNSKAFLSTWKDACQWSGTAKFLIPSGEYLVYAANFIGPCSGSITFQIQGVVKAPTDPSLFCNSTWISFQYVNGLEIEGGGTLDGQGASAWPYFDTSKNSNCPALPIAFLSTWKDACQWSGTAKFLIPSGEYLVYAANFIGPCSGSITFQIQGVVKAPTDPSLFCNSTWISFQYVNGLEIEGGGTLDGQGASAWPYFDTSKNSNCPALPIFCRKSAFTILLNHRSDSPNTDGIHMSVSTNIQVLDSNIGTGDDCISMINGSQSINISGITCGPGHGISIGSLGKIQNEVVTDVHVKNCTLIATQNGARIKTWAPSESGSATSINFEDIFMDNVRNPIIIDQHYCSSPPCSSQASSVQIKDVTFNNIRGTSSSMAAVTLNCSASFPCQGINLSEINLVYNGAGGPAVSSCDNAHGTATGMELPPSCLKSSLDS
uniref:Exopolygalacturonase-like n=1 Tax=Nicotiana tabacum TaxID=4097 RepID=A0A1S4BE73_TOBAC|nr:PREDICTED: exopolygalacturonase-like [Nicotiana tabacum]